MEHHPVTLPVHVTALSLLLLRQSTKTEISLALPLGPRLCRTTWMEVTCGCDQSVFSPVDLALVVVLHILSFDH